MESSEVIEAFLFSVFDIVAIFGIIALANWLKINILGAIVYPTLFVISFYTEVHEHVLSLGSTEEDAPYIAIFFLVGLSMFNFSVGVFSESRKHCRIHHSRFIDTFSASSSSYIAPCLSIVAILRTGMDIFICRDSNFSSFPSFYGALLPEWYDRSMVAR